MANRRQPAAKQPGTTVQGIAKGIKPLRASPLGGNQFAGVPANNPDAPVPGAKKVQTVTGHTKRPLPESEYLHPGQVQGQKVLHKFLGKP